jgi:dihydroorotate dehydrogenase electron transfer subunit
MALGVDLGDEAVGGCAGCTVRIATASGPAMKRVCVDGPVFDAYTVFPAN